MPIRALDIPAPAARLSVPQAGPPKKMAAADAKPARPPIIDPIESRMDWNQLRFLLSSSSCCCFCFTSLCSLSRVSTSLQNVFRHCAASSPYLAECQSKASTRGAGICLLGASNISSSIKAMSSACVSMPRATSLERRTASLNSPAAFCIRDSSSRISESGILLKT